MHFFVVIGPRWWGTFGEALTDGIIVGRSSDGRIRLNRTGPFMPPITFPTDPAVILSGDFKDRVSSEFSSFSFREVIKERIFEMHWETWDRTQPPQIYPASDSSESYFNDAVHCENASKRLGDLWELVIGAGAESRVDPLKRSKDRSDLYNWLIISERSWTGQHIFLTYPAKLPVLIASDRAKRFIECNAPEWATYFKVQTER